ncbi:Myb-like_DNA-binding domain-containing protein [Hexamita inflata]|uniref:Myb-like DNA-binding domain-containing protein n=1 Tax=Hexamita inflata TaxID=28002 RepID=A0AA86NUT7_9EUKA|nr:Myb-like DNA-binding domain-containing protein [Hexamita inflata]CAI9925425.1 Myb-like DNA-binding domain-containing protein [Hexamita inflata]
MPYHNWTKEEEKRLSNGVQQYGLNWEAIQQLCLPQMSQTSLKNKYYSVVHHIMVRRQQKKLQSAGASGHAAKMQSASVSNKSESRTHSEDEVLSIIKQIIEQSAKCE